MTSEEFKTVVLTEPHKRIVADYVFSDDSHIFRSSRSAFEDMRHHLSARLPVEKSDIVIVGSAKTGFSLKPEHYGRSFNRASDVDVIIVNEKLFDDIGKCILSWNYPRRYSLVGTDWSWCSSRRKDIYWGYFYPLGIKFTGLTFPDALKPIRDFTFKWFDAFQTLDQPQLRSRKVRGRLYRSWDYAFMYHLWGLSVLKTNFISL